MKKAVLLFLISLILFSCASIPQVEYDEANVLRSRVTKYKPVTVYAQDDFVVAEEQYEQADTLIKTKKKLKDAKAILLTAIERYKSAISIGMPAYAKELAQKIDDVLLQANELKTNIARPEQYNSLVSQYEQAKNQATSNDYDSALATFESVLNDLNNLFAEVKQKYDMSLEDVQELEKKIQLLDTIVGEIEKLQNTAKKPNK